MSFEELTCTYAALALLDSGIPVTATAINAMAKKAGIEVNAFWPNFFENSLKSHTIDSVAQLAFSVGAQQPSVDYSPSTVTDLKIEEKIEEKIEAIAVVEDTDPDIPLFDFF